MGRKQTGLKALTGSMCASISTSRQLSHSDHGRFTLRSLKPLPAAALMKKGIYHTQLQWRTTPKKCKACLFVNLYVLVQLRINRVTASGLYRKHCCRLCCRFPAKNASVPRSALLSRSSQGGCHLSYGTQSHIMHTVYTVYEQRNKQTKEKKKKKTDPGTNVRWHEHSHRTKRANAPTRTHFFFPPELVHSRYSNIKVITRAVRGEREGNGEGERHRESDCCGATLVYFSQFSFLGHRVCVQ